MDRRSFIRKAGVLGAGAAASTLAAPAVAQGNITWRMVTTWPKNFPGLGVGAQRLADRITAASGGRPFRSIQQVKWCLRCSRWMPLSMGPPK